MVVGSWPKSMLLNLSWALAWQLVVSEVARKSMRAWAFLANQARRSGTVVTTSFLSGGIFWPSSS